MTEAINQVEVCYTPLQYPLFANKQAIVVVIDVLRATSAICAALHHGVEAIWPVAGVEEALTLKQQGYLAAAERNGEVVEGFDMGNSPFSYFKEELKGATIVLSTTNGTQAVEAAREAEWVVAGSFLNLAVLTDWISKQQRDVVLLCAGWKNKFNIEDTLFAGAVVEQLLALNSHYTKCDSAMASRDLYRLAKPDLFDYLEQSSHRRRLEKLSLEKDIRYCLTPDQAPVIPVLRGNLLVKL